MGDTTTIRVSKEVYNAVKSIAQQQNEKIQDVIEQAIKDYKKKKFFDHLNLAYARLKADPKAWAEEEEEREDWDVAMKDGIESENGD